MRLHKGYPLPLVLGMIAIVFLAATTMTTVVLACALAIFAMYHAWGTGLTVATVWTISLGVVWVSVR